MYTEDLVWSTFYSKTVKQQFFKFFSKRAHWNLFIFAPHVVQTFPELAMCSDSMSNFVKGYLGKKYGVRADARLDVQ